MRQGNPPRTIIGYVLFNRWAISLCIIGEKIIPIKEDIFWGKIPRLINETDRPNSNILTLQIINKNAKGSLRLSIKILEFIFYKIFNKVIVLFR